MVKCWDSSHIIELLNISFLCHEATKLINAGELLHKVEKNCEHEKNDYVQESQKEEKQTNYFNQK